MNEPRVALLGFLPWSDPARSAVVRENPAALAAERCARALADEGRPAEFVPVSVSAEGIAGAIQSIRRSQSNVVVALGQTKTAPRVERFGKVPGVWAPALAGEESPWLLATDAADLASVLNELREPESGTLPFTVSEDAGAYYCDHLCVESARETRLRPLRARFLHVTEIDGCTPEVREARLRQYARQARAAVDWLTSGVTPPDRTSGGTA